MEIGRQALFLVPLEPSHWILLENPFHKSSGSARSLFETARKDECKKKKMKLLARRIWPC